MSGKGSSPRPIPNREQFEDTTTEYSVRRKSLSMSNVRSVVTSGRQILQVKTTPVTVVLSTVSSNF